MGSISWLVEEHQSGHCLPDPALLLLTAPSETHVSCDGHVLRILWDVTINTSLKKESTITLMSSFIFQGYHRPSHYIATQGKNFIYFKYKPR